MERRLPPWLKKKLNFTNSIHTVKNALRKKSLHTVCEEAHCPNLGECFSRGTATFMILGDVCTRRCGFCAVRHGEPKPVDTEEPRRVACQVREMGLKHAVITSVTRDDLADGGAGHFARTIKEVRSLSPACTIEVLTPDFEGSEDDIRKVCEAKPHVFNHNVETVERLTPIVRDKAVLSRSLDVLNTARRFLPDGLIKSGLMLGLGETRDEVLGVLRDLKSAGCDIVTIGQYLRPSKNCLAVKDYIEPKAFLEYEEIGLQMGFKHVFSGPFVRSSYLADKAMGGHHGKKSGA